MVAILQIIGPHLFVVVSRREAEVDVGVSARKQSVLGLHCGCAPWRFISHQSRERMKPSIKRVQKLTNECTSGGAAFNLRESAGASQHAATGALACESSLMGASLIPINSASFAVCPNAAAMLCCTSGRHAQAPHSQDTAPGRRRVPPRRLHRGQAAHIPLTSSLTFCDSMYRPWFGARAVSTETFWAPSMPSAFRGTWKAPHPCV